MQFDVCIKIRKPGPDIFRIAYDIVHSLPQEAIMIDDRSMFTEVAKTIGIQGLHYDGLISIKQKIALAGFNFNIGYVAL